MRDGADYVWTPREWDGMGKRAFGSGVLAGGDLVGAIGCLSTLRW
jgi:hypothetical protein